MTLALLGLLSLALSAYQDRWDYGAGSNGGSREVVSSAGSPSRDSGGDRLNNQERSPGEVPVTVFDMWDAARDERGPGRYTYPTHKGFSPFKGLFDLRRFTVLETQSRVYFELQFAEVTNPWNAPEGYFHQLMDIYIDSVPRKGHLEPVAPGPNVNFAKENGWDIRVKAAPWEGVQVFRGMEPVRDGGAGTDGREPVASSKLLQDRKTIRISVPRAWVGTPTFEWRYYVLVGSYDAFGPDNYRTVSENGGPWSFGGATEEEAAPRVIDMLAPSWTLRGQERLLSSYDAGSGRLATIYPVGGGGPRGGSRRPVLFAAAALLAALVVLGLLHARK